MAFITSTNPKDGKVLGKVEVSNTKQVISKVALANKAKEKWKEIGLDGRKKYLNKLYDSFNKRKEEIALLQTKDVGKSFKESSGSIEDDLKYFKWYLDNADKYLQSEITFESKTEISTVFYEPTGTVAVIVPWNFPFANFIWGVIPNLIVGNTVVFKHSEECPLFGKMIEEIFDETKFPEGVFSEVYGGKEVGEVLVNADIDLIWFTGSSIVGRKIYETAAKKFIKVILELGGSAPGIVFDDVDVTDIVDSIYVARFFNCGQCCDGLKRLIVHESIYNTLIEKLKLCISSKKLGDPDNKSTDLGPLVAKRQVDLLKFQVDDAVKKGAKIEIGGKSPKNLSGAYYEPTILTNIKKEMRVWKEEVFGPVLPVVKFKTEEEAICIANDTVYGLGAYVFTKDKKRAERVASKIDTGMVSINGSNYVIPCNPFGGNKLSGMGREHGKYGLYELTKVKVVSRTK